jgi:hypothetical protein
MHGTSGSPSAEGSTPGLLGRFARQLLLPPPPPLLLLRSSAPFASLGSAVLALPVGGCWLLLPGPNATCCCCCCCCGTIARRSCTSADGADGGSTLGLLRRFSRLLLLLLRRCCVPFVACRLALQPLWLAACCCCSIQVHLPAAAAAAAVEHFLAGAVSCRTSLQCLGSWRASHPCCCCCFGAALCLWHHMAWPSCPCL